MQISQVEQDNAAHLQDYWRQFGELTEMLKKEKQEHIEVQKMNSEEVIDGLKTQKKEARTTQPPVIVEQDENMSLSIGKSL